MNSFEQYPHTQKVLEELNLTKRTHEITWHHLGQSIDERLEEVIRTYQDLTSANIPAIKEARERSNREYIYLGNQLHIFAKEEARHQLGLSNDNVTEIFSKVEVGGTRFIFAPPSN